jgi:hypothetical protein
VLLWHKDGTWEQWMINESGRWSAFGYAGLIPLLPNGYTHWAIPTSPGTPPAVTAEVKVVLNVNPAVLRDAAALVFRRERSEEFIAAELGNHMNAIRAARAALGMEVNP